MPFYRAYGLCLKADLPLPLPLTTREEAPQIEIRCVGWNAPTQLDVTARTSFHVDGSTVYLHYAWIGRFRIREGREIDVVPYKRVGAPLIALWIVGHPLAVLLFQRGLFVLHGSLVGIGDAAISFLGGSGWGKSTLAAGLHGRGHPLLGDDVTAVELDGSSPRVLPGPPVLRLSDGSAHLVPTQAIALPLGDVRERKAYLLGSGLGETARPLRCLFTVEPGPEIEIIRCGEGQAFLELTRHTYGARYFRILAPRRTFQQCARVARSVPVCVLRRPKTYAALPHVCGMVEEFLARLAVGGVHPEAS